MGLTVNQPLRAASLVWVLLFPLAFPAPALSGDTQRPSESGPPTDSNRSVRSRAEQITREQAAKISALKPYDESRLEKVIDKVEDLVIDPPPLYPWFGSVYSGGLFAMGAGYLKPYGDTGLINLRGGWSFRNYKKVELSLRLPELANRRLRFDVDAELIDAPSVAFYGLGQGSTEEDGTTYLYRPATLAGRVTIAPVEHVSFGGGVGYVKATTGQGGSGLSIEERFTVATAPGLEADPAYVRSELFADVDSRTSPDYTDRGGWYHVAWYDYRQRGDGPHSFRRLDAEARQFIPILRANWIIALRGLVSITDVGEGDQVPYFLLPDLGGASELRGYPSWRFRDRHRILTSAEYRWQAGHFVDMALFFDAGKVTANRSELNLHDLTKTYGIGVRFHAPNATMLRIELARTTEGFGLVFTTGQSF